MAGPAVALVPDEPSVASNGTPRAGAFSAFQKPVLRLAGRSERKKRKSRDKKDKRKDEGVAPVSESCAECAELDGFVSSSEIDDIIRKMVGKYRGGVASDNVAIQQARGVIETGLKPEFIGGADCPEIDSEKWAIDYSYKRGKAALHKGIDIPQPRGTPIRVIADGVVVGRFLNDDNKKGIEVMVRHTPEQTGLTFWIYSQYTHLREMSPLPIGARVKMGDEIGKTSNTGVMGKRERRDALHFAILYSVHPEWSNDGEVVTPKDGYFMDPNAFYRHSPPYDSPSLLSLPGDQKNVPVPYMKAADTFLPPDTKRIWPYLCE
ncbi:MAG: M23 family metallopeptidase [Rhodospirillales bacterium]|nr:M23 family metallopeptidase [Rhodospirillales bacterium]